MNVLSSCLVIAINQSHSLVSIDTQAHILLVSRERILTATSQKMLEH